MIHPYPSRRGLLKGFGVMSAFASSSYHEFVYRIMYNGFVIFIGRQEDSFLPGR
jgi:hypothetical protein